MRCESCASGTDCPCWSWACDCQCQRFAGSHPVDPLLRRADVLADALVERERADVCRACGGDLEISVGRDEEDGERAAVRVAVECRSCGRER